MILLILLLLGVIAGIAAGLFGLGGGILFTPVLFVLFSDGGVANPVVFTIGSSLFCTFIASIGSSIRQYRQYNWYWKEGITLGVLGSAGVTAGKQVVTSSYYSQQVFVVFFSLLLLYVSYIFFQRGKRKTEPGREHTGQMNLRQSVFSGGLAGFVAALAGIGGGGVMVPVMNLYYNQAFKKAVSISSLAIVFISFAGWIQFLFNESESTGLTPFYMGSVDFGTALPLAAGGLAGGFLGALVNLKIDRQYLQYAFALLAVIMAFKLIVEVF